MTDQTQTLLVIILIALLLCAIASLVLFFVCRAVCHNARYVPKRHIRAWIPIVLPGGRSRASTERFVADDDTDWDGTEEAYENHGIKCTQAIDGDNETESRQPRGHAVLKVRQDDNTENHDIRLHSDGVEGPGVSLSDDTVIGFHGIPSVQFIPQS